MEALWSCGVEGDAFRGLVVEADRVLVSTGKQTLVVGREGDVLGRYEPPLLGRVDGRRSGLAGKGRYALEEGALLTLDAHGFEISRAAIPVDLFERHREKFVGRFAQWKPAANKWADDRIHDWWRYADLVADSERRRLLAVGLIVPTLAMFRTDGGVEWALLVGSAADCCNSVEVIANDGTLAHLSSCGRRITFVTTEGHIVSVHEVDGLAGNLFTDGRGLAYITDFDGRIAAYRPVIGRALALEVPHIQHADVRDGILYTVIKHPSDGILLVAFREPA